MTDFVCPEAEFHGNPFRYCGVKGCGWMEDVPPAPPTIDRGRLQRALQTAWNEFVADSGDHPDFLYSEGFGHRKLTYADFGRGNFVTMVADWYASPHLDDDSANPQTSDDQRQATTAEEKR